MTNTEPNPLIVFATIATIILSFVTVYFVKQTRKNQPVLDKVEFKKFPLIERTQISHNTVKYRFGLPRASDRLGLPIGQHIVIGATINDKLVTRSYTPISHDYETGYFDLMIKTYEKGNISKYIFNKKIGETIEVRGPKGFFEYTPNMVKTLGMIAGGTGITPMYQITTAILRDPEDMTKVSLIYANVTEDDILLKQELDDLAKKYPTQFSIHYVLEKPTVTWTGSVGYVTPEIIAAHLAPHSDGNNLLLCGPPPMVSAMKKAVVDLGFPKPKPVSKLGDAVFVF